MYSSGISLGHSCSPIDVRLDVREIKVLQVPVRCRQGHRDTVCTAEGCSHFFDKSNIVCGIRLTTTAVIGLGILPVEIDAATRVSVEVGTTVITPQATAQAIVRSLKGYLTSASQESRGRSLAYCHGVMY